MTDWIHLRDFTFPCIVGVNEREQCESQPITLNVDLNLNLEPAAAGNLADSVDYVILMEQLQFLAQHGRWRLIESMAIAMLRLILAPPAPGEVRAMVDAARVTVIKPHAVETAIPSIEIFRTRQALERPLHPLSAKVNRLELLETSTTGAYRVTVQPQGRWELPAGAALKVIAGSLEYRSSVYTAGQAIARGGGPTLNPTTEDCTVLAVSQPPFSGPTPLGSP